MVRRLPSLADLATLFGPDARAQVTKNGAEPKPSAVKENNMSNIARMAFGESTKPVVTGMADAPYALIGRKTMSVAEWISIQDNPRQRDTEKHAARAKKLHLRKSDPIHAMVGMAELPSGERYKLDGHTRSLLWQRGELAAPDELVVDIWWCRDEAAVKALYSRFDGQTAAETAVDRLRGAANEHEIAFKTPMLRDGNFGTAIKRIYLIGWSHKQDQWTSLDFVYDAVKTFKRELMALDDLNPQPARFTSGVIAAALVTLKRYGENAVPFWRAYSENAGLKDGPTMDGVQALSESVLSGKQIKKSSGIYLQAQIMYSAFTAYEGWKSDRPFSTSRKLRVMPAQSARLYIRAAAQAKNTWPAASRKEA
jgi:hypothetical protein